MKSFFKLTVYTVIALSLSAKSFAGVLIEPYLGYRLMGDYESGSSVDGSYNGAIYGARLGYQALGIMAGVDYSLSSYEIDYKKPANAKTKADSSNLGIFVGYEAPILLRVWGTYFISNKLDFKSSPTEFSGSGFALGAGYTGLPFVSLNLEYRSLSYDEFESGALSGKLNPNYDASEILFTVSLPLVF